MALIWDLKKCANFETLNHHKSHELVYATMDIGINKITKDNYLSFWRRMRILRDFKQMYLEMNLSDVVLHIGLETNADNESERKFMKKVNDDYICRLKQKIAWDVRNCTLIPAEA